jgi:hypothetical protein
MTRYTIVPSDRMIIIDLNQYADRVDFTGIDPTIHAVQWYDTVGEIEYKVPEPLAPKPPNERITDISPFQPYIDQAVDIIEAKKNPAIFYALFDGATYDGRSYFQGQKLTIDRPPLPKDAPEGFTKTAPPVTADPSSPFTAGPQPQWDPEEQRWVIAYFPITYSLEQAKISLKSQIDTNAADLVNNQLRNYSILERADSSDLRKLLPADFTSNFYTTVGDYEAAVNQVRDTKQTQIDAATVKDQLYSFVPNIPEPAQYTAV